MNDNSYVRVIPRDLFNESLLLKCLGKLALHLENLEGHWAVLGEDPVDGTVSGRFEIEQDPADGSISCVNIPFKVSGLHYRLYTPLNSRESFPLYLERPGSDFDPIRVLNRASKPTRAFLDFLGLSHVKSSEVGE